MPGPNDGILGLNIRLDLEGAQYTLMKVLEDRNEELKTLFEAELNGIIESFRLTDYAAGVAQHAVKHAIKSSIEHYFKYGRGQKIIDAAVKGALDDVLGVADHETKQKGAAHDET